ncbi:hypothetical protein [Nitratidesulfovibrio sp. SRB-5]|uniref:hypothetical protein n=1 Tax=Nitratidesulfovibrio sp. SRB-5 TaxID=2872636 RepID=UPI0010262961|nr:hypothetical protein [Nitratidesulfovibrio sp. SRB-5]MBZ2172912.1 hypothetical protein [Nitratidesulfovibrio sp. SRB-5]RXF73625.1 hypothetical protein EKK70_17065 [Desulfovibrio sp. DS-1]
MILFPDAAVWSLALPGGILACLLLAVTGLPFLCLSAQRLAVTQRSSFPDKLARQGALLAALTAAVLVAVSGVVTLRMAQMQPDLMEGPFRIPLLALPALLAGGGACAALYLLGWKYIKGSAMHRFVGLAAGIGGIEATACGFGLARALLLPGHPLPSSASAMNTMRALIAAPADSLLWPVLGQSVFVAAGAAGALCLAWLLTRRDKDDFGRDYYNYALGVCARWALGGTLCALPVGVYVLYRAATLTSPDLTVLPPLLPLVGTLVLPLAACGLWGTVIRSATPLRHKVGIVTALVLLMVACGCEASTLAHVVRLHAPM